MFQKWFTASRPWAFTAAIVPVSVGAAYAWWIDASTFRPVLFLLTLIGGVLIQAGTNYINTYGDFKSGVDSIESAVTCQQLVAGEMNPKTMRNVGLGCFALAAVIGFFLTYMTSWPLLVVGTLGIMGGYFYTAGMPYKYAGLGSIFVFFLMGPMMVWGSYFVQAGVNNWNTLLISIPISCLVFNILHANDLRDLDHDKAANIKTLALNINNESTNFGLYNAFVIIPFVSIVVLAVIQLVGITVLPWASLATLLVLPLGLAQIKQSNAAKSGDAMARNTLEPTSAQYHFKFGMVYFINIVIAILINVFL